MENHGSWSLFATVNSLNLPTPPRGKLASYDDLNFHPWTLRVGFSSHRHFAHPGSRPLPLYPSTPHGKLASQFVPTELAPPLSRGEGGGRYHTNLGQMFITQGLPTPPMIRKGMAKTSFPPPPCLCVGPTFVSGPSTFGLFAAIGTYGQAILPLANPHAAYTLPPAQAPIPAQAPRGADATFPVVYFHFPLLRKRGGGGGAEGCHVSHRDAVPRGMVRTLTSPLCAHTWQTRAPSPPPFRRGVHEIGSPPLGTPPHTSRAPDLNGGHPASPICPADCRLPLQDVVRVPVRRKLPRVAPTTRIHVTDKRPIVGFSPTAAGIGVHPTR